jgi:hypothetical protein
MKELGIKPGNSRDSQHRERFFVFQPKDHLTIKFLKNDWFWDGKVTTITTATTQQYH